MKVKLAQQKVTINAPRELVFQLMSAIGKGTLPGGSGERSKVLERDGDTLIAEFFTPSGKKVYRTVEEVRLFSPERITYRHLEGPLAYVQEEFFLDEVEDGTQLTYTAEIGHRVPYLPGIGWLTAIVYIRPKYDALIREHIAQIKAAAEARAARSHVFRRRVPEPSTTTQADQ